MLLGGGMWVTIVGVACAWEGERVEKWWCAWCGCVVVRGEVVAVVRISLVKV